MKRALFFWLHLAFKTELMPYTEHYAFLNPGTDELGSGDTHTLRVIQVVCKLL